MHPVLYPTPYIHTISSKGRAGIVGTVHPFHVAFHTRMPKKDRGKVLIGQRAVLHAVAPFPASIASLASSSASAFSFFTISNMALALAILSALALVISS